MPESEGTVITCGSGRHQPNQPPTITGTDHADAKRNALAAGWHVPTRRTGARCPSCR